MDRFFLLQLLQVRDLLAIYIVDFSSEPTTSYPFEYTRFNIHFMISSVLLMHCMTDSNACFLVHSIFNIWVYPWRFMLVFFQSILYCNYECTRFIGFHILCRRFLVHSSIIFRVHSLVYSYPFLVFYFSVPMSVLNHWYS